MPVMVPRHSPESKAQTDQERGPRIAQGSKQCWSFYRDLCMIYQVKDPAMRATVIAAVVFFSGSIAIIALDPRVAVMDRMVLSPLHRATEMETGAPIQAEAATQAEATVPIQAETVVAVRAGAPIQTEAVVAIRAGAPIQAEVAAVIQGGAAATAIQRGAGSP